MELDKIKQHIETLDRISKELRNIKIDLMCLREDKADPLDDEDQHWACDDYPCDSCEDERKSDAFDAYKASK